MGYKDGDICEIRRMLDEDADRNVDGVLSVLLNDQVLFSRRDDEEFVEAELELRWKNIQHLSVY